MRKIAMALVLVSTAFGVGTNSTQNYANPCQSIDRAVIEKHAPLKGLPYKIVEKRPFYNLCEVVIELNNQLIPLYMTNEYIISGEAFVDKKPITQIHLKELQKKIVLERKKVFDKYVVAEYKPKNFKGKWIYFFSDPECPYCNYIKKTVKNLADKYGVGIKLVFLPLPFHPHALKWSKAFICSNMNFNDYLNDKYKSEKLPTDCKAGEKFNNALKEMGSFVKATPTFLYINGTEVKTVVGASKQHLESLMKEISK